MILNIDTSYSLSLHNEKLLTTKSEMKKVGINESEFAGKLTEAGFSGLFQYGERSLCDSIWQDGNNQKSLIGIVSNAKYSNYTRILASEVLYAKNNEYPPSNLDDTLAYIYSQALEISGGNENAPLTGNLWGFMYYSDRNGTQDYGALGSHLVNTGEKSIPYLLRLLNNEGMLYYEGSEEATVGNNLKYRVKDAAAYYIGKIAGVPIQFYENYPERDAEIERLKDKLK